MPASFKSWRTTVCGLLGVLSIGYAAAHNPQLLTHPDVVAQLALSLGAIFASDARTPPVAPAQ